MCFILKQNAGKGLIQERADFIPQQINIILWIGMKNSLNRNVLVRREKNIMAGIPFFYRTYLLNFFLSSERGMTPRESTFTSSNSTRTKKRSLTSVLSTTAFFPHSIIDSWVILLGFFLLSGSIQIKWLFPFSSRR